MEQAIGASDKPHFHCPNILGILGSSKRQYAFGKGLPVYYYISPKVWAWKEWRVKDIRKYVRKVFSILPFETDFYARHGVEADYMGNPTANEIAEFKLNIPDFLAFMDILAVQYIGKLLEIAYNDDIPGAGEGQYTGGQIHLRSLIYDEIIVGMFKVQGALDGVGRAQDYRIFSIEFLGSSPEIPRFKTLAGLLPMELFTQFCPE